MGGSGGGFFPDPDIAKQLREAEARSGDQQFEAKVSGVIDSLLSKYNNRDIEAIQRHLDTIVSALEKDIEDSLSIRFGGSVAKHTYVDGISDIDALVLLDKSDLRDKSPSDVKKYFFERLIARFPRTDIKEGRLAVTLKFSDYEIQLLPAIRHEGGFKIADSAGTRWSSIKPIEFTDALTRTNQNNGGKVVPTIKLAKSIMKDLPESQQLSGYHVEAIAVQAFQVYEGPKRTKQMLKHFFEAASGLVLRSVRDSTGQSTHVDDYLGSNGSQQRNKISKALDRICRKMKNADGAHSLEQWKSVLD